MSNCKLLIVNSDENILMILSVPKRLVLFQPKSMPTLVISTMTLGLYERSRVEIIFLKDV
jgi:hypothetical protein